MSSPGGDQELVHDLLRHLIGVLHAMKHHVEAIATEFDLTLSQLDAMKNLGEPCSQRELATRLHFDASNVTDIVDRLEARGLVERTVDPSDRRVRRLVLTTQGAAVRRKLFDRAVDQAPINSLSAAEMKALRDLLAKVAEPEELPI
jgi:MarR family transcriptional regulator, organic hydroperoxide resistance regulator